MLSYQLLAILQGIGADGHNLSVRFLELAQFVLEGVELEVADVNHSPR